MNEGETFEFYMDGLIYEAEIEEIRIGRNKEKILEIKILDSWYKDEDFKD